MINFEFIVTFDDEWDCFATEIWHDNILLAMVTEHEKVHLFNEQKKKKIIESSQFSDAIDYAKKRAKG